MQGGRERKGKLSREKLDGWKGEKILAQWNGGCAEE